MSAIKTENTKNTINTAVMRTMNAHQVRRRLLAVQSATKAQLASDTGLSAMTVGTIIAQMQRAGEVYAFDAVPSNGGRPSVRYAYDRYYALSMIVYGYQKNNRNFFHLKILDMFGDALVTFEQYIDDVTLDALEHFVDQGIEIAFAGIADSDGEKVDSEVGREAAREDGSALLRKKIRVIGFGLPGVEQDGCITSNDYPKLVGTDFIAHFSARYGAEVRFFNDINAAVYGYYDRNRPAGGGFDANMDVKIAPAVVGIYYPRLYYPGMGIVIDGRIYAGRQNFAGEMGRLLSNAAEQADWLSVDYSDRQQVYGYIARDLYFICCVLAPERIVLYGDFLQGAEAGGICKAAETLLEGRFQIALVIASDFEADFDRGLRALTGELLYPIVFPEGYGPVEI